jgi:hypothetical protein
MQQAAFERAVPFYNSFDFYVFEFCGTKEIIDFSKFRVVPISTVGQCQTLFILMVEVKKTLILFQTTKGN